ncbi:FAD-binding protein [Acidisoma cellulosilytica]|uniref:FAD-binding protein n=2 Tax=Acidisoma cellulosilyticum TaxID=2802395 RepID=A0A964E5N9_9PROT|nr:FAD-dependent oxidoreductase [Acidisoma cellulosilyticum]MCB8882632.1 FAD-binding protein [Acidisoma cellulosilyticum]
MQNAQFDVVVAGCGAAGLSAAVAAAEQGAKVAVLERAPIEERGGQSRYTEAYLRMKSHDDVTDDFEQHIIDNSSGYVDPDMVQEMGRPAADRAGFARAVNMVDPDMLHTFATEAGPTIAWLKGFGLRFDFLPTQFLTKTQPRLLPVGGGLALVETLAAQAENLGVTFFYDTTAEGLEQNEDGQVIGLRARHKGDRVRLKGQVVLACGGFEGNSEMQTRYIGPRAEYLRPICKGAYYNRGEGIQMALAIGALGAGDFGSFHAEPMDPRSGVSEPSIFIFPYGILVNKEGERFTDEAPGAVDAHYERVTRRIYEQRDGLAYVILDARHKQVPNYRLALRTDKPPFEADTVESLAAQLAVPPDRLAATVSAYNDACRPGQYKPLELDNVATVGLHPPKSHWALPIDQAPFHAYPIISANVFTFGGLKVDSDARVLDSDGLPIRGLYAAGEIIGLFHGTYTGATSVLKGLVFGRRAGQDAALRRNAP